MKIIILLLLTVVSYILAEPGKKRSLSFHPGAEIVSNHLQAPPSQTHFEQNPSGFYKFSYTSPDGSQREESGSGLGGAVMQGSYAYIAPDGTPVQVSYVADENGFRPIGNIIPRELQESYFPEITPQVIHEIQKRKHADTRADKQVSNGSVLKRIHRD